MRGFPEYYFSGNGLARLQGERGRTSGQMRLFAKVLRRGDFSPIPCLTRRCLV